MPDGNKKKLLYEQISKEFNLGSYEQYEEKLNNPNKRKLLYDAIGSKYKLGSYQEFETKLGYGQAKGQQQSPTTSQPVAQPKPEPKTLKSVLGDDLYNNNVTGKDNFQFNTFYQDYKSGRDPITLGFHAQRFGEFIKQKTGKDLPVGELLTMMKTEADGGGKNLVNRNNEVLAKSHKATQQQKAEKQKQVDRGVQYENDLAEVESWVQPVEIDYEPQSMGDIPVFKPKTQPDKIDAEKVTANALQMATRNLVRNGKLTLSEAKEKLDKQIGDYIKTRNEDVDYDEKGNLIRYNENTLKAELATGAIEFDEDGTLTKNLYGFGEALGHELKNFVVGVDAALASANLNNSNPELRYNAIERLNKLSDNKKKELPVNANSLASYFGQTAGMVAPYAAAGIGGVPLMATAGGLSTVGQQAIEIFSDENLTDEEKLKRFADSKDMAIVSGVILGGALAEGKVALPNKWLPKILQSYKRIAGGVPYRATAAGEGFVLAQIPTNIADKQAGYDVGVFDHIGEAFKEGVKLDLLMQGFRGAVAGLGKMKQAAEKGIPKNSPAYKQMSDDYKTSIVAAALAPKEAVESVRDIPEGKEVVEKVNELKNINDELPTNLNPEQRFEVLKNILDRQELEKKAEEAKDATVKSIYQRQIKEKEEQIQKALFPEEVKEEVKPDETELQNDKEFIEDVETRINERVKELDKKPSMFDRMRGKDTRPKAEALKGNPELFFDEQISQNPSQAKEILAEKEKYVSIKEKLNADNKGSTEGATVVKQEKAGEGVRANENNVAVGEKGVEEKAVDSGVTNKIKYVADRQDTPVNIDDIGEGYVLHRGSKDGGVEGFNSLDSAANGYAGEGGKVTSSVIKKGAKVIKLVKGDTENYTDNEDGINEFYKILGEKERAKGSEWAEGEMPSDITTRLWGNESAINKLKKAGVDIVIGNTIDGVDAFIVNKNAVEKYEPVNNNTQKAKSFGYDNEHQALNSTNKRLGKQYKSFDEIPESELKEASEQRNYDKFKEEMITLTENVKDSSFDFAIDIPALTQKDRAGAIKDIREGKNTKRRERFEAAIKTMYDNGVVSMTRGRGNHVDRMDVPLADYMASTKESRELADKLDDATVRIIEEEGITLGNIDKLEHLFDGFPYDKSDLAAVKDHLRTKAEGSEQPRPDSERGQEAKEQASKPESEPTGGEQVKKRVLAERAYDGKVREEFKKHLEDKGLYRQKFSPEERSKQAEEIINKFGHDNAVAAVQNGDVVGAVATSIMSKAISKNLNDAAKLTATDVDALDALGRAYADMVDLQSRISYEAGELNSQFGWELNNNPDLQFNTESMSKKWKDQFGEELPKDMEAKFRALDTELKEIRKQLAEAEQRAKIAEEQQAVDGIKESLTREKKSQEKKQYAQKALEVVSKLRKQIKANNYSDVTGMVAIVDTALATIETAIKGGMKVANAIEKGIAEIKAKLKEQGVDKWEKEEAFRNDVTAEFEKAGIKDKEPGKPFITDKGKLNIPERLIKDLVEQGNDTIESLTAAIQEIIKEDLPDVTERTIRDSVTEYGKTISLSKAELDVKLREIKRIGRILSALEDIEASKRPVRSGLQRDKPSVKERQLRKQLAELMKDLPVDEDTQASQLKTKLDAAKTRVQNQIEELEKEIETRQKVEKSKTTLEKDAELKELIEQRDKLKAEHEKIFLDEAELERQRIVNAKIAAQKRIDELERRLRDKDFSTKPKKKPISDSEVIKLRAEKLRLQEAYDVEFEKKKIEQRTFWQKRKDDVWDAWQLPRATNASGEFSFVGIQGWKLTISYIVRGKIAVVGKAFKNALRAFASEKKSQEWLRNIKSQDWYPILKESKLALTEPSAKITAREELGYSGYTDKIWNAIILPLKFIKGQSSYEHSKKANPFRMFERASSGYLDMLRVTRFLEGMEMLNAKKIRFEDNPKAFKELADVINTMTGRASIGFMEKSPETWTKILYSPRNWASAIKTATPYAFYHFGKMRAGAEGMELSVAQKVALGDMSRMVGLTTSMVLMAAAYYNSDDDPETGVDFDWTSSNFAKIKVGKNIVIDPWGGMIQQVVLTSRIISTLSEFTGGEGGIKASDGKFYPMGTPYKTPNVKEMLVQSATNKLNPAASFIDTYADSKIGKGGKRQTKYGKDLELKEVTKEKFKPIYWGTLQDLAKDGYDPLDGFLAFWSFFGGGLQVQEEKKKK